MAVALGEQAFPICAEDITPFSLVNSIVGGVAANCFPERFSLFHLAARSQYSIYRVLHRCRCRQLTNVAKLTSSYLIYGILSPTYKNRVSLSMDFFGIQG